MKIRNSVKISFKGKDYEIDIERISYVISKIEDCEMKLSTKEEIIPYLKKHKLFDEYFLKNINKI